MGSLDVLEFQAELCKAMGNTARLQIVYFLHEGPKNVGDIIQETGLPQANVSRHLAVLRNHGIASAQRRGNIIVYRITNPKIMSVCDLMREVLAEQLTRQSEIANWMAEQA